VRTWIGIFRFAVGKVVLEQRFWGQLSREKVEMKARDVRRKWTAIMRNEQKEAMLPWIEISSA
jgi:hypothetical protein